MSKEFYRNCPICKKKPTTSLFGIKGYLYCSHCRLGWLKKLPKISYKENYYKGTSGIVSKLFIPIGLIFYKIRGSFAEGKNKLWIDVGAGDGGFLKTVSAQRKIGIEISQAGRKIMEKSGLETLSNEKFLKTSGLDADVISYWHVLEHVEKPWEYLKAGKRNLSKKGKIIIGIPNIDSYEFQYFRNYWFHLVPKYHLWHFSKNSIELFLGKAGFKINSIDNWSIEHHLAGTLQSFINRTAGSDSVLHRLVKRGLDYSPTFKDIFWSVFWLTFGLPVVFLFWGASSILKKPGTFILVAKKIH